MVQVSDAVIDGLMESVYRLVPIVGHKRAIVEVAGECIDEKTDQFRPCTELQAVQTERYEREMQEFTEAGGY